MDTGQYILLFYEAFRIVLSKRYRYCDQWILWFMKTWFVVCIVAYCLFWFLKVSRVLWTLDRWILRSMNTWFIVCIVPFCFFVYCDLLIDEPCEHLVHCLHCCFLCIVTSDRWQKQHRRRSLPYWSPSHHTWNLSNLLH